MNVKKLSTRFRIHNLGKYSFKGYNWVVLDMHGNVEIFTISKQFAAEWIDNYFYCLNMWRNYKD